MNKLNTVAVSNVLPYNQLPVVEVEELRVPQLIALVRKVDQELKELEEEFADSQNWIAGRKAWAALQRLRDHRDAITRILENNM